jgi:hypothetical protein
MNHWHREPTITEILSDSIVRSLMQADGVDPDELEAYGRRANHGPVEAVSRGLYFSRQDRTGTPVTGPARRAPAVARAAKACGEVSGSNTGAAAVTGRRSAQAPVFESEQRRPTRCRYFARDAAEGPLKNRKKRESGSSTSRVLSGRSAAS